jgi:exopolysaccharide biosynthesis polyprenyl glycosylphosphotransferase
LGDIIAFSVALWVTLFLRSWTLPSTILLQSFILPFSILFIVWVLVFFIAGLYEKHTIILKSRLPSVILNAHIINIVIAFLFFYFVPIFGIAPKTTLIIYLFISFGFIVFWRLYLSSFLIVNRCENAIVIGAGKEMGDLLDEVNKNNHYGLNFVASIDLQKEENIDFEKVILDVVENQNVSLVVIDLEHDKVQPIIPKLYSLIFSDIRFVSMYKVYEDVFRRVPFFILRYDWFLENISTSPKIFYDIIKRGTDILLSFIGGVISLVLYPFVYFAIKLDDGGPVFIVQERIGKSRKKIKILKFRSMTTNDRGVWVKEKDDRITRVGKFLRKSRIDELPQFWNVFRGDISLIGPRPDVYDLGVELSTLIPYYPVRSTVKPGLSGWAQVSQEIPPQSLEETKLRLAYDLYYVKNRSIPLDINIIFKTIRTLLSRTGK